MASRGRSQVAHRTARIWLTVVQWEHSHGDRDGLEEHRQLKNKQLQARAGFLLNVLALTWRSWLVL